MSYFMREYPEVVKETDKYVEFIANPSFYGKQITKEHKFVCIGGPFDGEYYTRTQIRFAAPWGYEEFNRAGNSLHRVIFAWTAEDQPEKPEKINAEF